MHQKHQEFKKTACEIDRSVSRIAENVKYIIFDEGTFHDVVRNISNTNPIQSRNPPQILLPQRTGQQLAICTFVKNLEPINQIIHSDIPNTTTCYSNWTMSRVNQQQLKASVDSKLCPSVQLRISILWSYR